jgi:O-antigen/teichoic acid export membrane protein
LVSTIVLARLLLPSDFGVIVLASIVIGFVDTVFDLGVHIPLIQRKNPSRDEFDTAWTLRLLQSIVAAVVLLLVAEPAAAYLGDDRVGPVMQVLAAALLFVGLENIGTVYFQRHLQFRRDFLFLFVRRISGVAVALFLAWHLQSYWALVAGTVTGRAVGCLASYALHPYRPRLSLAAFRSLWSVSQWTLVRNLAAFAESRVDKLAIAKLAGSPAAGAYGTAEEFALLPITEFLAPLGRALLPLLASANQDGDRLRLAYLHALEVQCLVAIPAAVGLHCIAPELVLVVLGVNWIAATPFLATLALVGIAVTVTHAAFYVFMATGRMALLAALSLFQLTVLVCLLALTWRTSDPAWIPWLRLLAAAAIIPPVLYCLLRTVPALRLVHVGRALIRPSAAALSMYLALLYVPDAAAGTLSVLAVKVLVGVLCYIAALFFLWFAAGRPAGPESRALATLQAALARIGGRS